MVTRPATGRCRRLAGRLERGRGRSAPSSPKAGPRLLFGWAVRASRGASGLDGQVATGCGMADLIPGLIWSDGLAGRLFDAMGSGQSDAENGIRTTPQAGPRAGQERLFDVHFAVVDDTLAAEFRDVTERH